MSGVSRRALLRGLLSGFGVAASGCIVPSRPPPVVSHAHYPLFLPGPARGRRGQLFVGAANIDITPPAGSQRIWLAGYGFQRPLASRRDPISARCLYLDDGERRVALVVADVIGLLRPTIERVRKLVGAEIAVAVSSTHNHQSPDTMGYWGPAILYVLPYKSGLDTGYQRVLEKRMAAVVKMAVERAEPVEIAFARAELPDGVVKNLRNPGVYDRAIELVEARRPGSGEVVASLVNFGCHAETLGDRERALSADFPAPLRARIESARGGTAVFANGILGGMITPDIASEAETKERSAFIGAIADKVADVALPAISAAKAEAIDRVDYLRAEVELKTENALFGYIERVGLIESRQLAATGAFTTEVGRIDLGPASWALLPGEPTPMVGMRVKAGLEAAGRKHPIVIGLANDELGYLLDPSQFDDPLFDYESSVSPGRSAAPTLESAISGLPIASV